MKIMFAGDISTHHAREIKGELAEAALAELLPVLKSADYRLANQENVLCKEGVGYAIAKSGPNLRGEEENIDLLKDVRAENLTMVTRITEDGEYAAERNVGGIVGTWDCKMPLTLENCYYSGKVVALDTWEIIEADMYAGGFIGFTVCSVNRENS
jgi:hypothetical protein